MWSYRNPVEIDFGAGSFDRLPALIAGRPFALVTYGEPIFAGPRGKNYIGDPERFQTASMVK